MELLGAERILSMFSDFGLGEEEQRQRLFSLGQTEPLPPEGVLTQMFIRAESTTNSPEGGDAQLA